MDVCTICVCVSVYAPTGGFRGGSVSKESTCDMEDTGDVGSIPGSGRSPGGGHGNPLQYSGLENSMDRAAWWATVHGVTKNQTQLKPLNMHTHIYQSISPLCV